MEAIDGARTAGRREPLPPGAVYANVFSLFNAMSWQITLGSPAILYAKSLGASATVLGVIASLSPLLVILQIPAANLLPKYGYRRFILAGWGSRTICIFGLAVVPLLVFLDMQTRLVLVLLLLFGFNLLRGMASGAWLPWISQIIPERMRGRFLSRDQMFAQAGCLLSLIMATITLGENPVGWRFSLVFLFSAVGATMSLWFIRQVPDVTAPEQLRASGLRVPWLEMAKYRPFLRLTLFNLLYVIAIGGIGVFSIAYLRGEAHYPERWIVGLSTLAVIGAIVTLQVTARAIDRIGSRPILLGCMTGFVMILLTWFSTASGILKCSVGLVMLLNLATGIVAVNYAVANNRLAMVIVPRMGSNHFFAIFTVTTNMVAGLSPICWGLMLDGIGSWHKSAGLVDLNRFSLFFGMAMFLAVVTAMFGLFLEEKRPETRHVELAIEPQATGASPIAVGGAPAGMQQTQRR